MYYYVSPERLPAGFISRPRVRKEPCVVVVLAQAFEGPGLESRSQLQQLVFKSEQKLNLLLWSIRPFVIGPCPPLWSLLPLFCFLLKLQHTSFWTWKTGGQVCSCLLGSTLALCSAWNPGLHIFSWPLLLFVKGSAHCHTCKKVFHDYPG